MTGKTRKRCERLRMIIAKGIGKKKGRFPDDAADECGI